MKLTNMEKSIIDAKVNELLNEYGFDNERDTYVDITKFANFFGFNVMESKSLPFLDDGFIFISEDRSIKFIVVNYERSREEKRFIVAHEIAHFYLHTSNDEPTRAVMHREHRKGKDENENDADYFAASLLMPKESFVNRYEKIRAEGCDDYQAAVVLESVFGTSRRSAIRRIEEVCSKRSRRSASAADTDDVSFDILRSRNDEKKESDELAQALESYIKSYNSETTREPQSDNSREIDGDYLFSRMKSSAAYPSRKAAYSTTSRIRAARGKNKKAERKFPNE